MPPRIIYQSSYDANGDLRQCFDGVSPNPIATLLVSGSAVLGTSQAFFHEGKRLSNLSPFPKPSMARLLPHALYLQPSPQSPAGVRRWLTFDAINTSNEIALGYHVIPEGKRLGPQIDDIDTVIILVPRASRIPHGCAFPLIGAPDTVTTVTRAHPTNGTIQEIATVGSYDFLPTDRLGFVVFARCWSPTFGLSIDYRSAFWTRPHLNADADLAAYPYSGFHYATYLQSGDNSDGTATAGPAPFRAQIIGCEDTRTDWGSDRDYNDIVFAVSSVPLLPMTTLPPLSTPALA